MSTAREFSKREWEGEQTLNGINAGSLQRIADACEKMATSWTAVAAERDKLRKALEEERKCRQAAESWRDERILKLERRITSLKGVITRMRRRPA